VIWYRHWLEMRRTVLMCVVGALVLSPIYYQRELRDPRPGIDFTGMFAPLEALTPFLDAAQIKAVARHTEISWVAILFLSFLLAGDGLRVIDRGSLARLPSATQFTLALPITRRRVVLSRIAATYATTVVILGMMMIANVLALMAAGQPVPLGPMLLVSGFASLLILFWSTVFVLVSAIVGAGWGMAVAGITMLLSVPAGLYGMTASAALQLELALLVLFAVIIGLVLAGAVATASSDEA
jgi:hypothetical protein